MGNELKTITTPLSRDVVRSLKAGDEVLVSGVLYSARDQAHKRLCRTIEEGGELPFDLSGACIYFLGPSPARPGRVIGAAGPTTSSRMDAFSPALLERGLAAMIGKGYRSDGIRDALKKFTAVHLSVVGGAAAVLSKKITACEVIAYEDLGAEAIRRLEVVELPAVVAYDCHGGSVYDR